MIIDSSNRRQLADFFENTAEGCENPSVAERLRDVARRVRDANGDFNQGLRDVVRQRLSIIKAPEAQKKLEEFNLWCEGRPVDGPTVTWDPDLNSGRSLR